MSDHNTVTSTPVVSIPAGLEGWGLRALATVLVISTWAYWCWQRWSHRRYEDALAAQKGCQPVLHRLPYKWPFALDLLWKQYRALPSGRLLEFQTPFITTAPTIRIDILREGYSTTDPENVETVLNTNFEDYSLGARRDGLYPLLGEGIFTQDGSAWRHSRELLRRQFARLREGGLSPITSHVTEFLSAIEAAADGSPDGIVDLQPHFFEFTLGTTTALLFGEPHSSLPRRDRDALRESFDYASYISAIRIRLAELAWVYKPRRFNSACDNVRAWALFFADKALDYKEIYGMDAARERYPFIIDLWDNMRDRNLVRDQLLHVLIAGRDTTACLLSWTLFHLVRNPHLIKRLQDEIAQRIPTDTAELTRNDINQLMFLRCCLHETLRLYPQLPVNVRFAVRPTILPRGGGPDGRSPWLLRKGQGIGWSTYHMHRSEALYGPDARVYRPERWEDGTLLHRVHDMGAGFLDFHTGPRLCLGKDFALMEASYAIVRILQTFPNIRLPAGVPNEPVGSEQQNLTIVLSSANGCTVLLK
ncbi:cytochrome P450 [Nemania serpens]|nr:cytochrome P450 [Nemania serpens]